MRLYTCAFMQSGIGLVNTKRLRCFKEPKEVTALLDLVLQLDCVVERWYAKAEYQGYSYDLRAVVQDGRIAEQGSHEELLSQGGYYYDLYSRQFEEEAAIQVFGEGRAEG